MRLPAHGWSRPRRLPVGPHPPDPSAGLLHRLLSAGEGLWGRAQGGDAGPCRIQAYRLGGRPDPPHLPHVWDQPWVKWVQPEAGVAGRDSSGSGHPPHIPQAHPSRLQILVAVVQYQTRLKEPRRGLCSSWLASLDPGQGGPRFPEGGRRGLGPGPLFSPVHHGQSWARALVLEASSCLLSPAIGPVQVPLWVRPGGLTFPQTPGTPVIMVGPGTGVAPFRAAVQERVAQGQSGEHTGSRAGRQLGLDWAKPGGHLVFPQETFCSLAAACATRTSTGRLSGWSWRGGAA